MSFDNDFLFIPNADYFVERNIIPAHAVVRANKDGTLPLRVMNLNDEDVKIYKGTSIGCLEVCVDEESTDICMVNNSKEVDDKEFLSKVSLEHLNKSCKEKMELFLCQYKDVFSQSKYDIGHTNVLEHNIILTTKMPVYQRRRPIPMAVEKKVNEMVDEMIDHDIVEPCVSPYNSPLVIIKKKNNDLRICVDFRRINAMTERFIVPLPSAQELFDRLGSSRYFSVLDLTQGYYQIPVAQNDRQKTAFTTTKGQFMFKRMPFGLNTAPLTFTRMMNLVLKEENFEQCLIYLDDILIFSKTEDEHFCRLANILEKLRKANLKLSPSKCMFLKEEVSYLGHVVDKEGLKTDPNKTKVIKEWPTPTTAKELRKFLGFCGYYRKFIKDYANTVRPLETLLNRLDSFGSKKSKCINISHEWNQESNKAFNILKEKLTNPPLLAFPNQKGLFILDTDASNVGIGCTLSQIQDNQEKVISYASHKLTKSEKQY